MVFFKHGNEMTDNTDARRAFHSVCSVDGIPRSCPANQDGPIPHDKMTIAELFHLRLILRFGFSPSLITTHVSAGGDCWIMATKALHRASSGRHCSSFIVHL
jgi:hypothetical protein